MLELTYEGHLRVGQTGKWETNVLRKRDKTYKEREVHVYGTFQGTIGSSWLPTGKGFRMSIRRKGICKQDTQPKFCALSQWIQSEGFWQEEWDVQTCILQRCLLIAWENRFDGQTWKQGSVGRHCKNGGDRLWSLQLRQWEEGCRERAGSLEKYSEERTGRT